MTDGTGGTPPDATGGHGRRDRDLVLVGVLVVLLATVFVAGPLAAMGHYMLLAVLMPAALLMIIVLTMHSPLAFVVAIGALALRCVALVVEAYTLEPLTVEANALAAILAMLALIWVVWHVVFGPGRVTAYRVHGAVALYLAIAILFTWVYRLIAAFAPGAFTGIEFRPGDISNVYPYVYYSLTTLTTLGFGDIAPVNPLARAMTTAEAVIGQLYLVIVLGRILSLYSDHRKQDE